MRPQLGSTWTGGHPADDKAVMSRQQRGNGRVRKPIKIYVNGRFLAQPLTGVRRFALQTIKAIDGMASRSSQLHNEFSFEVLAPRNAVLPTLKHIAARRVGVLRGHLWDQLELPLYARSGLLLSLCGAGPIFHREHVVAIHDASVFANPLNFLFHTVHCTALSLPRLCEPPGYWSLSHTSRGRSSSATAR